MEIIKSALESLTNHYHFQFISELIAQTNQEDYKAVKTKLAPAFTPFLQCVADEDAALLKIRKSQFEEEKQEAGAVRDQLYSGIVHTVKAGLCHFDETVCAAAERINIILNQYGNVAKMAFKSETFVIVNLLQELRNTYASDLTILLLEGWLAELEKQNNRVVTIENQQTEESADKTGLRMRDIRLKTDAAYRVMIKRLEALMLIEGEIDYQEYAYELNTRIEKYENIIALRKSDRK